MKSGQPSSTLMAELQQRLVQVHGRSECNAVIDWIGRDTQKFMVLVQLLQGNNPKLAAKAAWPFPDVAKLHAASALDALPNLLNLINQPGIHHAVKRGILKWLTTTPVPEIHHGKLMHACFETAASTSEKPAAKAYALHLLGSMATLYPDIRPELQTLIAERSHLETPAFKAIAQQLAKSTFG